MKKFLALRLSDVVFIMLINAKMPTIVGILTFMSRINFVLSWFEHGKSFINSRGQEIGSHAMLFSTIIFLQRFLKSFFRKIILSCARRFMMKEWFVLLWRYRLGWSSKNRCKPLLDRRKNLLTSLLSLGEQLCLVMGSNTLFLHLYLLFFNFSYKICCFCLVFVFNVPVNIYGHVETVSRPNHTFFPDQA